MTSAHSVALENTLLVQEKEQHSSLHILSREHPLYCGDLEFEATPFFFF